MVRIQPTRSVRHENAKRMLGDQGMQAIWIRLFIVSRDIHSDHPTEPCASYGYRRTQFAEIVTQKHSCTLFRELTRSSRLRANASSRHFEAVEALLSHI